MKIYLSGPMTGYENYNKKAFDKAEAVLKEAGYEVVNPASLGLDCSWVECMKIDIGLLVTCDALYMLKGWKHSQGACLEHWIAHELGMEILMEGCEIGR